MMFVDLMGTLKKFIAENEGNAWYFENQNLFNTWHAAFYFIDDGEEYLIDYNPIGSIWLNPLWDWDMFLGTVDGFLGDNIDEYRQYAIDWQSNSFDVIELWSNNIDTSILNTWYKTEYLDGEKYNTFTNNCSDQVEEALNEAWFFKVTSVFWIPTPLPGNFWFPWTTPGGLGYDIKLELFYKNLLN